MKWPLPGRRRRSSSFAATTRFRPNRTVQLKPRASARFKIGRDSCGPNRNWLVITRAPHGGEWCHPSFCLFMQLSLFHVLRLRQRDSHLARRVLHEIHPKGAPKSLQTTTNCESSGLNKNCDARKKTYPPSEKKFLTPISTWPRVVKTLSHDTQETSEASTSTCRSSHVLKR